MNSDTSYTQWIENYLNKKYTGTTVSDMISYGWYDWFCEDRALPNRFKKLARKVVEIYTTNKAFSNKFDGDNTYIFFKNNCPMIGRLYDDFRICDSDGVLYTIIPERIRDKQKISELWGRENDFAKPIISGDWDDIINYFTRALKMG